MGSHSRWKFVSSVDPGAVVIVHDRVSAEALARVLQGKLKGAWTVHREHGGTHEAAPIPVAPASDDLPTAADAAPAPDAAPPKDVHPSARRRYPRIHVKVWITLLSSKQTFRSFTREVSLGGLSLEHKLPPALLGTFCRIYIHGPAEGERIELRCRVHADPRNPRRIQFLSPEPESLERLRQWIEQLRQSQRPAA